MNFVFLLGIIAFLQVVFLPGWLILHAFKIEETIPKKLLYSFGLSLMANYTVIFPLVSLHLYTQFTVACIIVAEIILFSYLYRDTLLNVKNISLHELFEHVLKYSRQKITSLCLWWKEETKDNYRSYFFSFAFFFSICSFVYIGYLFMTNLGTIFSLSDPAYSWNPWAVQWSQNTFPTNTWEYPQLVTTNWSLFYVIIGKPIQFFAKAIMPLFFLGILSTLFIFSIRKKSLAFLLAVPATVLFMRLMNGSAIMATEGYVDSALTFFTAVSLFSLLSIEKNDSVKKTYQHLLIGALFAFGAAMTKQGGIFILAIYPILSWLIAIKDNLILRKKLWRYTLIYLSGIFILVAPYYVHAELAISSGKDVSVIPSILQQLYGGGENPAHRAFSVLTDLTRKTYGLFLLFLLLVPLAWRDKKYKLIISFVLLPYLLIWLFFVAYDTRNLSLIMPLLSISACLGIEYTFFKKREIFEGLIKTIRISHIVIFGIICLIAASPLISKKILNAEISAERRVYDDEVSLALSNYFENPENSGVLYTADLLPYLLAATKNRLWSKNGEYREGIDFNIFINSPENKEVSYIFIPRTYDKETRDYIQKKIDAGEYSMIFNIRGNLLIKANHPSKTL